MNTAVTAETRFIQVGERIAWRSIGAGTPIVLANRMRGTLDTWDPLFLDALAARHTVITVDYPGIGYSTGALPEDMGAAADFIVRFATAISLHRFVVLGWSWGGSVAQAVLVDHPERVTHAILVGANPPGHNEFPMQQVFIERALKPVNDLADEEVLFFEPKSEFSRTMARASHQRIYTRPGVVEKIPARMEQIQMYLKAAGTYRDDATGRRAGLARTRIPILVISGDNDTATPGQNWLPLIGQLRSAQFIFYPQTGHGPQHQYPELSAHYIASFLAQP